jgi:hypothetical protein
LQLVSDLHFQNTRWKIAPPKKQQPFYLTCPFEKPFSISCTGAVVAFQLPRCKKNKQFLVEGRLRKIGNVIF